MAAYQVTLRPATKDQRTGLASKHPRQRSTPVSTPKPRCRCIATASEKKDDAEDMAKRRRTSGDNADIRGVRIGSRNPQRVSYFSSDLRPPRVRHSAPANQRFVSVAPKRRRSLSRRSVFLRNLHEQLVGIVQPINGRRGAWRSRWDLPEACFAAAQHMMLGAISTARKSPVLFDCLGLATGLGVFAGCLREIVPSSPFSTLIMTSFQGAALPLCKDSLK